jgi:hypothetical protein
MILTKKRPQSKISTLYYPCANGKLKTFKSDNQPKVTQKAMTACLRLFTLGRVWPRIEII